MNTKTQVTNSKVSLYAFHIKSNKLSLHFHFEHTYIYCFQCFILLHLQLRTGAPKPALTIPLQRGCLHLIQFKIQRALIFYHQNFLQQKRQRPSLEVTPKTSEDQFCLFCDCHAKCLWHKLLFWDLPWKKYILSNRVFFEQIFYVNFYLEQCFSYLFTTYQTINKLVFVNNSWLMVSSLS